MEEDLIRAKWAMDGAADLSQAAARLRELADSLEQMERDGWQLAAPVADDYGIITREKRGEDG